MKKLFFLLSILLSLFLIVNSCSDSGTNNEPQNHNVSVTISPTGAGSISPSAGGTYQSGEQIELHASEKEGYLFVDWTGDVQSADNPLSLTVVQDYRITANFEKKSYELTINTDGEGSVNEKIIQSQAKSYDHGTVVELTAESAYGWSFVKWEGDIHATSNPLEVTVDKPKSLTAVFERNNYSLSIETYGEGGIIVVPEQAEYEFETVVELVAEEYGYWKFDSWEGDLVSTDNPVSITIDGNKSVVVNFRNTLYSGGLGTELEPFQISTLENLQNIRENLNSHFHMINDIDASDSGILNSNRGFLPIGEQNNEFTGSFNGNGNSIINLTIDNSSSTYKGTGLFGGVKEGKIKDVKLVNIHINGGEWNTGALVGSNRDGEIKNSSSSGVVFGQNIVGGLVGFNAGIISNSYSESEVTADVASYGDIGGLAGAVELGIIQNSYALGKVSGVDKVGGLVGNMYSGGKVRLSFASVEINGTNYIGGIAGSNCNEDADSYIEFSYWDKETSNINVGSGQCNLEGTTGLTSSQITGISVKENMPEFDWNEIWITTNGYPKLRWQVE